MQNRTVMTAIFLPALLLTTACGTSKNDQPNEQPGKAPGPNNALTVSMAGRNFSPRNLHVATNAAVTFNNNDLVDHAVTSTIGAFESGTISAGSSWTHVFMTGGTFRYFCRVHPEMQGEIEVGGDPDPNPSSGPLASPTRNTRAVPDRAST